MAILFANGPTNTNIVTYKFGRSADYGLNDFHRGVDVKAATSGVDGDNVYAVAGGMVKSSAWHESYGWNVVIEHGGGFCTRYAHLMQKGTAANTAVSAGTVIGKMGNTGQSTGTHLHFELYDCLYSEFWKKRTVYVGRSLNVPIEIVAGLIDPEPYIKCVNQMPSNIWNDIRYQPFNMIDLIAFDDDYIGRTVNIDMIDPQIAFDTSNMTRRSVTDINTVVIHHLARNNVSVSDVIASSLKSEENDGYGVGYNFYVDQNGVIYTMRPVEYVPAHVIGADKNSVGVCFEGDYNVQSTMPEAQKESGARLLAYLHVKYDIRYDSFKKHSTYGEGITCPGAYFPFTSILDASKDIGMGMGAVDCSQIVPIQDGISNSQSGMIDLSQYNFYIVTKNGESLDEVASKYNVDVDLLKYVNYQIHCPSYLSAGDIIVIPTGDLYKTLFLNLSIEDVMNETVMAAQYCLNETYKDTISKDQYVNWKYNSDRQNTEHQSKDYIDIFGNKKSEWQKYAFDFPGYTPCCLLIELKDGSLKYIPFLVSPSDFSDSRSEINQINKTTAGYFIYKLGSNLTQINISGYMLDTKHEMERHAFLQDYKMYIVDKRTTNNDIINDNKVKLMVEGTTYTGYIESLNFVKSSMRPFLYQYSIRFVSLFDQFTYKNKVNQYTVFMASSSKNPVKVTIPKNLNEVLASYEKSTLSEKNETLNNTDTDVKSEYGEYIVKKGDTLIYIAKKFNMTLEELLAINPNKKSNPNAIYIGETIYYKK